MSKLFNTLISSVSPEAAAELRLREFEQSKVTEALRFFGAASQLARVTKRMSALYPSQHARFEGLDLIWSNWPARLACSTLVGIPIRKNVATPPSYQLHTDVASTVPAMMKTFTRSPLYIAYRRFYDSVSTFDREQRPIGLVVPRRGLRHGLVIHNGSFERFVVNGGAFVLRDADTDLTLVVQPYASFLSSMKAAGWSPSLSEG
jgi:hypothetical protein